MKKFVIALLAMCLALGVTMSFAQDTATDTAKPAKAEKAPPLKWVTGDISADGTKLTTKSGKAWDIKNPDAVKGHEGHHVKVQAHVYKKDNAIHVMEVKMAGGKKSESKM